MTNKVEFLDLIAARPMIHHEPSDEMNGDILLLSPGGPISLGPDTEYADDDAKGFGEMLLNLRSKIQEAIADVDEAALIEQAKQRLDASR